MKREWNSLVKIREAHKCVYLLKDKSLHLLVRYNLYFRARVAAFIGGGANNRLAREDGDHAIMSRVLQFSVHAFHETDELRANYQIANDEFDFTASQYIHLMDRVRVLHQFDDAIVFRARFFGAVKEEPLTEAEVAEVAKANV